MSVADKIGLFPFAGWMAGHSVLVTLIICWAITPGAMVVIAWVLEGRRLPLSSEEQFRSFFPGDLFLGIAVTSGLVLAQDLPAERRWYNGTTWHGIVLGVALLIAAGLTFLEFGGGIYPVRALFSPTKLYHNFVLYAGYGYVVVTTITAVAVGLDWRRARGEWIVIALIGAYFAARWALLAARDSTLSRRELFDKANTAHVADWRPIWSRS